MSTLAQALQAAPAPPVPAGILAATLTATGVMQLDGATGTVTALYVGPDRPAIGARVLAVITLNGTYILGGLAAS